MLLTVGQVSAIIAAVIFLVQFLLPNAVTLILVGVLRQTHTAVTWSVVQRNLFSSHWPLLTNSDSVAARGVDPKVRYITFLKPIGLFLISLAAVVTPLGLHDDVVPYADTDRVAFGHLPDPGPFGYASMKRDSQQFTRVCAFFNVILPCPNTTTQIDFTYNGLGEITNSTIAPGTTYDVSIPQSFVDLYESGLSTLPDSVASFFDIESRLYTYANESTFNDGKRYVVDTFRMLRSLILDETIQPIEGLIVDARSGGIGFRNHSVPRNVNLGAEWSEEILFIEPETECVNTNLTYEFDIGRRGSSTYENENIFLVDEGGFVNLNHTYPAVDMSDPQKKPNLRDRAYKAAWLTNAYAMLYMNVTRPAPNSFSYLKSELGKHFPLTADHTSSASANGVIATSSFLSMVDPLTNYANFSISGNSSARTLYSNPFKISDTNYSSINTVCQGAGGMDLANATNIHVECGLVFGAAQPADGTTPPINPFPYTKWRQPIYACASASRASIKKVTFHFNTTMAYDVSALSIVNVTDKIYADEASMPRWGVESVDYTLNQIQQLWGIVSEANADAPNVTTFKAPSMRLPGFQTALVNQISGSSYIPGNTGPNQALSTIYDSSNSVYDWTGQNNIAMMQRWRSLANSPEGAAAIVNLIWTDVAANGMTSSKNWNHKASQIQRRDAASSTDSNNYVNVPVMKFERRVRYKWVYSIPAFIVLALATITVITALVLSVVKHAGLHHVRFYTDSLSSGRLLVASQYPGVVDKLAPTKAWVNSAGKYLTSVGPMRNGMYQQPVAQQQHAPPAMTTPMSAPVSMSTEQTPPSVSTAYHNAYHQGEESAMIPSEQGYVGPNAPWTEKGYGYDGSTNEIPLTPMSSDYRTNHNGYTRVNNT